MNNVNFFENLWEQVMSTLISVVNTIISFIPELIAAIVLLLIGWLVAALFKMVTKKALKAINVTTWLEKAGVSKKSQQQTWINLIAKLVFWTVLILFLVPVFETLHLPRVTTLLTQLVLFIPDVIAAVIIGFIGFVVANLFSQTVKTAAKSYGGQVASILASVARYAILTFTLLIALNVLGVAPVLLQIFMIGIMLTFALAFGLSLGLGGKTIAEQLLNQAVSKAQKKASSGKSSKK